MKTYDIEIDCEGWKGNVVLKLMPYEMRLKLIAGFNKEKDDMKKAVELIGKLKECLVSISLSHSGQKYENIEDLEYTEDGSNLLDKIALMVMKGAPAGNVLRPKSKGRPKQR